MDRFLMKVLATYPEEEQEVQMLRVHQQGTRVEDLDRFGLRKVGGEGDLLAAQREVRERLIRDELLAYVARLVRATRSHLRVEVGASPRAGLMLLTAAKARAALRGRGHVLPDDVKAMTRPVLRHRIVLKAGAEVDGVTPDHVLDDILARRTRISIETPDRGVAAAQEVAELVAPTLGWDTATAEREVEHYRARVKAELESQEQPDDHTADAARLGAPDVRLGGFAHPLDRPRQGPHP